MDQAAPRGVPRRDGGGRRNPPAGASSWATGRSTMCTARTGAGMRTVLIPNSDVPTFADAVPDAVIERLADLLALIDRW